MDFNINDFLNHALASSSEPIPFSKLGMATRSNEISAINRKLNWQRFIPGKSNVPPAIRYELERKMREFRLSFAPYARGSSTTPGIAAILKSYEGMLFAFVAEDKAITDDDLKALQTDNSLSKTQKASMMELVSFVMDNGIKLMPPPTDGEEEDKESGEMIPVPPTPDNPDTYGNLSDLYLSYYGYAFRGIEGINVEEGQQTRSRIAQHFPYDAELHKTPIAPLKRKLKSGPRPPDPTEYGKPLANPADERWYMAERAYIRQPQKYTYTDKEGKVQGKLAELQVLPNSAGHYALYFVYRRMDPSSGQPVEVRREPVLMAGADINDRSTFGSYYRNVMKGELTPMESYVLLPKGPGRGKPIHFVSGRPDTLLGLVKHHATEIAEKKPSNVESDLKLYEESESAGLNHPASHPDPEEYQRRLREYVAKKYRVLSRLRKEPRGKEVWQVVFDGPEGGLMVRNDADPTQVFPLGRDQVEQLVNWGKPAGGSYFDHKSPTYKKHIWNVQPSVDAIDPESSDIKGKNFGRWDIDVESKDHIRRMFKQPMDQLSSLLQKYWGMRHQLPNGDPAKRHVATQGWRLFLVSPRHSDPRIEVHNGKLIARTGGKFLNPSYFESNLGTQEGVVKPPIATPYPQQPPSVSPKVRADSHELLHKLAAAYHEAASIPMIRSDWVALSHEINPNYLALSGSRLGPYESIGGKASKAFTSPQAALMEGFAHYGIPSELMPSESELSAAATAFENASHEIANNDLKPDITNAETKQVETDIKQFKDLFGNEIVDNKKKKGRPKKAPVVPESEVAPSPTSTIPSVVPTITPESAPLPPKEPVGIPVPTKTRKKRPAPVVTNDDPFALTNVVSKPLAPAPKSDPFAAPDAPSTDDPFSQMTLPGFPPLPPRKPQARRIRRASDEAILWNGIFCKYGF